MKNQVDKSLLFSYFSGGIANEQKRQLELWLNSDPAHKEFFYECLEEWERMQSGIDLDLDADFENLTNRIIGAEQYAGKTARWGDEKEDADINPIAAGRPGLKKTNGHILQWTKRIEILSHLQPVVRYFSCSKWLKSLWYTIQTGKRSK